MGVADGGYEIEDMGFLCISNSLNSKELKKQLQVKGSLSSWKFEWAAVQL
jgi:hypothetical protein